MDNKQIKIIDCFTQLIVYTLEFMENAQDERYSIEKLVEDYERLIVDAQENTTLSEEAFLAALFPIVAWIDEMVLSSQNKEKRQWRKQLLQKKLFNTSNAGNIFYDNLKSLAEDAFELRFLYLYCIFLGFKGKYYKPEDEERLDVMFNTQKELLQDTFIENFPQFAFKKAYAQNQLPSKKRFKTSYQGVWIVVVISLTVAFILFLASQTYLNGLLDKHDIF